VCNFSGLGPGAAFVSFRLSAQIAVCGVGLSLTSCSTESFDSTTTDLGERWKLANASDACNAEIEHKRWGSVAAILTYEQRESDHGYAACMNGKAN
jgi:hypothetical protein